jgi:hypothetical protein
MDFSLDIASLESQILDSLAIKCINKHKNKSDHDNYASFLIFFEYSNFNKSGQNRCIISVSGGNYDKENINKK